MANWVYVASSVANLEFASFVIEQLAEQGGQVTYDWTKHGSVRLWRQEDKQRVAEDETDGVCDADLLVALLPGGKGTHCEIGMALALGLKVFLFVPRYVDIVNEDFCNFYNHPLVTVFTNVKTLINAVEQES